MFRSTQSSLESSADLVRCGTASTHTIITFTFNKRIVQCSIVQSPNSIMGIKKVFATCFMLIMPQCNGGQQLFKYYICVQDKMAGFCYKQDTVSTHPSCSMTVSVYSKQDFDETQRDPCTQLEVNRFTRLWKRCRCAFQM